MGIVCGIKGHLLRGAGKFIEGECRRVRRCRRCGKDVVEKAHRDIVTRALDPANPCLLTTFCTACKEVRWAGERHDWSTPELIDPVMNIYSHRCSRGHVETWHEHRWELEWTSSSEEMNLLTEIMETKYVDHYVCRCGERKTV